MKLSFDSFSYTNMNNYNKSSTEKQGLTDDLIYNMLPNYQLAVDYRLLEIETKHFPSSKADDTVKGQHREVVRNEDASYKTSIILRQIQRNHRIIEDKFKDQWNELEEDEKRLKQKFKDVEEFLKNNITKRDRSLGKINHYMKLRKNVQERIDKMKAKVEIMREVYDRMVLDNGKLKMYMDFLMETVKLPSPFYIPDDFVTRFMYLEDVRLERQYKIDENTRNLHDTRDKLEKRVYEFVYTVKGLEMVRICLWQRREKAVGKVNEVENQLIHVLQETSLKVAEIEMVRQNCWNLYCSMCDRWHLIPSLDRNDTIQQLHHIKDRMATIRKVLDKCRQNEDNSNFRSSTI